MKVRTFLKASVLALLVATVGAVSAQDSSMTCLNLSSDDCAYINSALENGAAALESSSFQADLTIDGVVSGIPDSKDAELHVVGSGPFVSNPDNADVPFNFGMTIDASTTDGTTPQSISTEVRLIDGVFYVQNPDDKTWVGAKASDVSTALQQQMSSNPMVTGMSNMDLSSLGLDEADMTALMALPNAEGFLDYTRDGETFTFTADVGTLFKSKEWTTLISQITPKLQQNADLKSVATLLPLLSVILPEAKITVVEVVDPSINAVTEVSLSIDGAANASMMGGGADPIKLAFKLDVKLSDIGGDFTIEVPADAKMQEMPAGK